MESPRGIRHWAVTTKIQVDLRKGPILGLALVFFVVCIHALGFLDQIINEISHRPSAAPSHNVRRYFVCDAERKYRRMPGAAINGASGDFRSFAITATAYNPMKGMQGLR